MSSSSSVTAAGSATISAALASFMNEGNAVFRELASGTFGTAYVFIPESEANQILSDFNTNTKDRIETMNRIRGSTKTVKVISPVWQKDHKMDLEREIKSLTDLDRANHRNIPRFFTSGKYNGKDAWYTMELLTGKTLEYFVNQCKGDPPGLSSRPPEAFAWHVLKGLVDALLLIQFGIKDDGNYLPNFIGYYHGNVKDDNILFRMPARGVGFGNYPDVVLADFGLMHDSASIIAPNGRDHFFERQKKDIEHLVTKAMDKLVPRTNTTDTRLTDLFQETRRITIQEGSQTNEVVKDWLTSKSDLAARMRVARYQPLPPDIVRHFSDPASSDKDLVEAWPELADQGP